MRRSCTGRTQLRTLAQIDGHVDIVNVFRRPEHCVDIARAAVEIGASALWLQQGVRNDEAMAIAEAGGLKAVQDRCLRVEVQRLLRRR